VAAVRYPEDRYPVHHVIDHRPKQRFHGAEDGRPQDEFAGRDGKTAVLLQHHRRARPNGFLTFFPTTTLIYDMSEKGT